MAGIYLHIPFCKQACTYCDFYFTTRLSRMTEFVRALCLEIEKQRDFFPPLTPIRSVYFGGGTPSILPPDLLASILNKLHAHFPLTPDAEITLEANPDDIDPSRLSEWKNLGINRISLGLQSMEDSELQFMHRAHNAAQSLQSVDHIRKAGFDLFTLDFIYGIPGAGLNQWKKNLDYLFSIRPPHFSAYALTVEPRTRLYKEIQLGKTAAPSESEMMEQFLWLQEASVRHGYEAYEISNYALPGKRAVHNSSYWYQIPYLGFGPAAHSFRAPVRRANLPDLSAYIHHLTELNQPPPAQTETLTQADQVNELIMTRLRLSEGISLSDYQQLAGHSLTERCSDLINNFINKNIIRLEGDRLFLTTEGKLQADGVAAGLFLDSETD